MKQLKVENFGPIRNAEVTWGDLTILIGPQASGKSLFLELFKLIVDRRHIMRTLQKYNYILSKSNTRLLLDDYFGEGLSTIFTKDTNIEWDKKPFGLKDLLVANGALRSGQEERESVFYIPAQRILSIADGRPKNFMEFDISTPYVLRIFSETLRVFIQGGLGNPETIFPIRNRLKDVMKKTIDETIFHGGQVVIDQSSSQRKMKLQVGRMRLPFMTWSAGQKEFMPLLLAIYCLSGPPTAVIDKENFKWVIIEEPEMGLHPRAIEAVILEIMELMQLGYKVIVSTHSPVLLEFAWAFRTISQSHGNIKKAMCELFGIADNSSTATLFDGIGEKEFNAFYFSSSGSKGKEGVHSSDISSLDVTDENVNIAEWGGLSAFAGKASEIVSKYYRENSEL